MSSLTIVPDGPFSLAQAATFGFGPRTGGNDATTMAMAFCVDGYTTMAGLEISQRPDGTVAGRILPGTDGDHNAVSGQVARILGLDQPTAAWWQVGQRDRVISRLQQQYHGFRPVLFHSPYEAATWAIVSNRWPRRRAREVMDKISGRIGRCFERPDGGTIAAFPTPAAVLEDDLAELTDEKARRLHGIADAAADGRLAAAALAAGDPAQVLDELQGLRGIGPFASSLVLVRGSGVTDVLAPDDPRTRSCTAHFYELDSEPDDEAWELITDRWRPFRTWATVLVRYAGVREGLVPA